MSVLDSVCRMKLVDGSYYLSADDIQPLYEFAEKAEPLIAEMLGSFDALLSRPYQCEWLQDYKRRAKELGVET